MRKLIPVLALLVIIVGGLLYHRYYYVQATQVRFRTAQVKKGTMQSKVSCTGTLSAVTTVKVGCQVSGVIKELHADFNSEVREGQIIARIEPDVFEAKVRKAEADLQVALANVEIRRASVKRAQSDFEAAKAALASSRALHDKALAALKDAEQDLKRHNNLFKANVFSKSRLEDTESIYEQALAQVTSTKAQQQAQESLVSSKEAELQVAEAQESHAVAQVELHRAALNQSQIDLRHTVIKSPVDGIVIERAVDVGQTVAAQFQTPTLFVIAKDLKKMQVEADLDEADIGRIRVGQAVVFTVDAFPSSTFSGLVSQVRKAPKNVQNVVTYTVVASADNPDLRLLPGMTANVDIVVAEIADSIMAPNAALRFKPPTALMAAGSKIDADDAVSRGEQSSSRQRLKRLIELLKMTEDQEAQVWQAYGEVRNKIVGMVKSRAPAKEIKMARENARRHMKETIQRILNTEQKKKFRELTAFRAANPLSKKQVWIPSPDGKAVPSIIVTGINDGSYTQVVRGDLKQGQEVIIGLK